MLTRLLLVQSVIVGLLVGLTSLFCGVELSLSRAELRTRAYRISPIVALLALTYLFNRRSHTTGQRLSALIGWHITDDIYALEGDFVAGVQGVVPDALAGYFTFVYLFGFMFVLVFPIVAYAVLPSRRYLTELFVAYAVNYGVGAICYVLFIAYGPRKVIAHVGQPMYELYPQVSTLTGAVNSSANVFPSLHASLTVTVVALAWRTRAAYPRWAWLATGVALNVLLATMVLGIHWLIDLIAGIGLAALSVLIALRVAPRLEAIGRGRGLALGDRKR